MATDASAPSLSFVVSKFDKERHDRTGFSSGHGPMDNFLKSSLSDQIKAGMVAAYVATLEGRATVLGYYTLGAMAVRASLGPNKWQKARVPDIPVISVRAVAVRKDMQGQGLGTALVVDAIKRCVALSQSLGAAAIVLDVLEDEQFLRRQQFYANLGFRSLGDPENPNRVFLPMVDARKTLGGSCA